MTVASHHKVPVIECYYSSVLACMTCLDHHRLEQLRSLMSKAQFRELVEAFIASSRQHLKRLQSALEQQDVNSLRFSAHSLKGSCANLGCDEMSGYAQRLEQAASQADLPQVESLVKALKGLHARVADELRMLVYDSG